MSVRTPRVWESIRSALRLAAVPREGTSRRSGLIPGLDELRRINPSVRVPTLWCSLIRRNLAPVANDEELSAYRRYHYASPTAWSSREFDAESVSPWHMCRGTIRPRSSFRQSRHTVPTPRWRRSRKRCRRRAIVRTRGIRWRESWFLNYRPGGNKAYDEPFARLRNSSPRLAI